MSNSSYPSQPPQWGPQQDAWGQNQGPGYDSYPQGQTPYPPAESQPPAYYGGMAGGYDTSWAPYGIEPISGLPYSSKSKVAAGLLGIFLGSFGVGRFYTGHISLGVAQILVTWLTCGVGSVWPLVDGIILLATDSKDSDGYPLRD